MKQKLIKIIGLIVLVLIIVVIISTRGTATAKNPNSQKIADLTYQISELEYIKTECLDNLSYKQSIEQEKGFTKYCVEYDEKIMELQAQIDDLKSDDNEIPFIIKSNSRFCEEEIKQELRNIKLGIQNREGFIYLIGGNCEYEEERITRAEQIRNAEWYPGKLTEDGSQQEMPVVMKANGSHEAFKELATAYGLDAGMIWNVENHYGIKEGVILCITVAETSGGNRGVGNKNIGSVGSNDRGDRPTYALMESGLEDIGRTLTNKYLGSKKTLGCLSNAGSCIEENDNGKRYATSDGNWERNMVACLSTIYGNINASDFNIRR